MFSCFSTFLCGNIWTSRGAHLLGNEQQGVVLLLISSNIYTQDVVEEKKIFLFTQGPQETQNNVVNQCPFGLPLTFVFIALTFVDVEYLFCISEQGNAYITCMPGPVRRWNYPVPLCLGNVWIYGHCLYFRQQTNCVVSEMARHLCSSTHSSFVCFALKIFVSY